MLHDAEREPALQASPDLRPEGIGHGLPVGSLLHRADTSRRKAREHRITIAARIMRVEPTKLGTTFRVGHGSASHRLLVIERCRVQGGADLIPAVAAPDETLPVDQSVVERVSLVGVQLRGSLLEVDPPRGGR